MAVALLNSNSGSPFPTQRELDDLIYTLSMFLFPSPVPSKPPSYFASYQTAAALGTIPGASQGQVAGSRYAATNTVTPEILSTSATPLLILTTPPTADAALSIVSDNAADDGDAGGTGAWAVQIDGVKADSTFVSETVTLTGTTPVTTTETFYRVNTISVVTTGSDNLNQGTITVTHPTPAQTLGEIQPEAMSGSSSALSVPKNAGPTLQNGFFACDLFMSSDTATEIAIWVRPTASTGPALCVARQNLIGTVAGNIQSTGVLPQGLDFYITARKLSAAPSYNASARITGYVLPFPV